MTLQVDSSANSSDSFSEVPVTDTLDKKRNKPTNFTQASEVTSIASSLTSIHSEILRGETGEGRRTYAVYGKKGMLSDLRDR